MSEAMPRRVRLDPDYNGWNGQVLGWPDGEALGEGWPLYCHESVITELRKEVERLRAALSHYACKCGAPSGECAGGDLADCGWRARAALQGETK